jgi:hypothetical protein
MFVLEKVMSPNVPQKKGGKKRGEKEVSHGREIFHLSSIEGFHRVLLVDTCGTPGLANCIEADCKVPGTEDVSRSLPEESVQDSIVLKPPLVSAHMLPMYSMYSIPKYPHTYRVHT